mgnify:FL=1|jgi:hypothetical protein
MNRKRQLRLRCRYCATEFKWPAMPRKCKTIKDLVKGVVIACPGNIRHLKAPHIEHTSDDFPPEGFEVIEMIEYE